MEALKRKRSGDSLDEAIDPELSSTQQVATYCGSYDLVIRTVKKSRWTQDNDKAREIIGGAGNLAATLTQHEPANTAAPGEVTGLWKNVNNVTRSAEQERQERAREVASRDTYMGELEEAFDKQLDLARAGSQVEQNDAESEASDTDDEDDEDDKDDEDDQSDDSQESEYCYCERPMDGLMIGCDGPECEREWFHLGCMSLEAAPDKDEVWYCEYCRPRVWQASLDLEDDCWRCPYCGWELFEDTDDTEEVILPGKMPRVCHSCRTGCGDEYGEHTAYFEEVQKQETAWNERVDQDGMGSESPSSEDSEDSEGSDSLRSMIDDAEEVDGMWCEAQHSECLDIDCTECSDQEYHTKDTSSEESDSDSDVNDNLGDEIDDDDDNQAKAETVGEVLPGKAYFSIGVEC